MINQARQCALLVGLLSLSSPAWADQIRIVSGTFNVPEDGFVGSLTMTGDSRGFTWQSGLFLSDGMFGPSISQHPAGVPVNLGGGWIGMDILDAIVTLDGQTFDDIGGLTPLSQGGRISFSGLASQLPTIGSTVLLRAPFTFDGSFSHVGMDQALELAGQGTATLIYNFIGDQSWQLSTASYVFEDNLTTVPEPASLLLLTTGLAFGVLRRRCLADHASLRSTVSALVSVGRVLNGQPGSPQGSPAPPHSRPSGGR